VAHAEAFESRINHTSPTVIRYGLFVTERQMQPKSSKKSKLSPDAASALATQALAYIAGDEVRLGRFLAESGLGPETLRKAARDPSFLPAVLDFILSHEQELLDFAAAAGIDVKEVSRARNLLAPLSGRS
jgi:hypothetical protein